jgi:integrase/recombinase XerD
MSKLVAWLDTRYSKAGKSPLYLRTYLNGTYVHIALNIEIEPANWNKDEMRITAGDGKKEKNLIIKEALGRAADILLRYKVNKQDITKDLFLKEFKNPTVLTDFYEFMRDQILARHDLADSSKRLQLSIVNKIKAFRDKLLIVELDYNFLQAYNKHLMKLGQKTNTIHKDMKVIKTYINRAIKLDLVKKNPFNYFKAKLNKTYPTFLTQEEKDNLVELYKNNTLHQTLHNTLRQFLFCCYTGLRVSDLKNITWDQIQDNVLKFQPIKSKNVNAMRLEIQLPIFAQKLLEDQRQHSQTGIIFQELVERRLNIYIKEIAKLLNLKKSLSMHVARHTFATLFLRQCKAANGLLLLQKIMGHSSLRTTEVYLHTIENDIHDAMRDFK